MWERSLTRRPRYAMANPHTDAEDEAQALALARSGDLDAFDRLVRLHFPRVYALLFRMIGNHEDAEDLAQDCFLKAQRSLQHFRGESSFGTWLFRIAVHRSRDHFRGRSRGLQPVPLPVEEREPASPRETPVGASVQRELQAGLRAALERLPHKHRVALVLRTQEGLDYDDIAAVLECTPQTARVHVMKARRRLERWLRPYTSGDDRRNDGEDAR